MLARGALRPRLPSPGGLGQRQWPALCIVAPVYLLFRSHLAGITCNETRRAHLELE